MTSLLKEEKQESAFNVSSFADFTAYERAIMMAEIYHNIWYDQERFEKFYELMNEWKQNPVKEKKFMVENISLDKL